MKDDSTVTNHIATIAVVIYVRTSQCSLSVNDKHLQAVKRRHSLCVFPELTIQQEKRAKQSEKSETRLEKSL